MRTEVQLLFPLAARVPPDAQLDRDFLGLALRLRLRLELAVGLRALRPFCLRATGLRALRSMGLRERLHSLEEQLLPAYLLRHWLRFLASLLSRLTSSLVSFVGSFERRRLLRPLMPPGHEVVPRLVVRRFLRVVRGFLTARRLLVRRFAALRLGALLLGALLLGALREVAVLFRFLLAQDLLDLFEQEDLLDLVDLLERCDVRLPCLQPGKMHLLPPLTLPRRLGGDGVLA